MTTLPLLLLLAAGAAGAATPSTSAEFDLIDSNDDGRISSGEHEVYARLMFDQIDANRDYKLSVAEIMANESKFTRHIFAGGNILGPAELTTREKIQRIDANQDGDIDRQEHANAAAAKFQKMDLNNNGELTPDEFAAGG